MALIKVQPEFVTRPWGKRSLDPLFGSPQVAGDPIGEVWLTSTECGVVTPEDLVGRASLGEFWAGLSPAQRVTGDMSPDRFPLLVKFLFTAEKLSIQVHPDDKYASEHSGEPWGKTEAWYVLAAEPDAWVKVGFKPEVAEGALATMWGLPEMEDALNHLAVKPGDTIFVPAGTVHSIGPGVCLCEVQQYSDVTYRVYDYDRQGLDGKPRQLHLEEARAVAQLKTPRAGIVEGVPPEKPGEVHTLVSCQYFVVDRLLLESAWEGSPGGNAIDIYVFCEGGGRVSVDTVQREYGAGECFLAVAEGGKVRVEPEFKTRLLRIRAGAG